MKRNIIVIGGSYLGHNQARTLASTMPSKFVNSYRILLIEKNSHFNHLFTFPRFAAVPNYEHKAFVPMANIFNDAVCEAHVICAKVESVNDAQITLDRSVPGFGEDIDWAYLVLATGSTLPAPVCAFERKSDGVRFLRDSQQRIKNAKSVALLGAGAVGVQLATDIKALYPEKTVHLVHSRDQLLNRFDKDLHVAVLNHCREVGIEVHLKSRAVVPPNGFPPTGPFDIQLTNGNSIKDVAVVIPCTGQVMNTQMLANYIPHAMNPDKTVHVLPTLQVPAKPNIFCLGDINDTLRIKAVRPAIPQVQCITDNIFALLDGKQPKNTFVGDAAGIHLTLGFRRAAYCRQKQDPSQPAAVTVVDNEANVDMNVENFWDRLFAPKNDFNA